MSENLKTELPLKYLRNASMGGTQNIGLIAYIELSDCGNERTKGECPHDIRIDWMIDKL